MLKNLINYIKDKDYLIGIYEGIIYIYNYENILDVTLDCIRVKLPNKKINIKGKNLYISRLENKELAIKGEFKEVSFYE